MKNVFIAVGGSGTKVAEALIKLLAVGFPTRRNDEGILTSAGDSLEIWRVDPDGSSGAAKDLQDALKIYQELQAAFEDKISGASARSNWATDVQINVRYLDPTDLPRTNPNDNSGKTLKDILDSRYIKADGAEIERSTPLLTPFYQEKDLNVKVDRGFYQKPFIGSAVMAIFAKSLENTSTPAGQKAGLAAYHNTPTNFFLCGSLHGGTGASGVPVMAQFLKRIKEQNSGWKWRIGGSLLAPYVTPPNPPFDPLPEGTPLDESQIDTLIKEHGDKPVFQGILDEDKRELVKQILQGFYADPEDMVNRARQSLAYYRDYGTDYFDELYLVGKPHPNKLKNWSNGGSSQKNPLNSAEVVAAISALNFFTGIGSGTENIYLLGNSAFKIPQETMRLKHLPSYRVGNDEIDAERVLLATALTSHLILHQIKWENVRGAAKEQKICAFYDEKGEPRKNADLDLYKTAIEKISNSVHQLLPPHNSDVLPTGWSAEDWTEIYKYLASDEISKSEIESKLAKKGFFSSEAKGENRLGTNKVKFTTFDFGSWCPDGDQFSRGEYFRFIWQEIYRRCQTQAQS